VHDLRSVFANVCLDVELQRVEFDGEADPVHLLVTYPSKIAVIALVNALRASDACYGIRRCNRQATSLEAAVEHPLLLSDNVSSHRGHLRRPRYPSRPSRAGFVAMVGGQWVYES